MVICGCGEPKLNVTATCGLFNAVFLRTVQTRAETFDVTVTPFAQAA